MRKVRPFQRIKVVAFKPVAPHRCGFKSCKGFWIISCEEDILLAYGRSTVLLWRPFWVFFCNWNDGRVDTWGLPPPLSWKIAYSVKKQQHIIRCLFHKYIFWILIFSRPGANQNMNVIKCLNLYSMIMIYTKRI
jgi:hypothetical protein